MDAQGRGATLGVMRRMAGDFVSSVVLMLVLLVTGNIFLAAGLGVTVGVAQLVWLKLRGRPIEPMQIGVVGLVAVLAAATFITRDPHFVQAKLSIFMTGIGLFMLKPGWPARYMPPAALERIPYRTIVIMGYVWAAAMFGVAIANLLVAHYASVRVWAVFSTFAPWTVVITLMLAPRFIFRRRSKPADMAVQTQERAS